MSIAREILKELLSIKLNYKGIPVNIFGMVRLREYYHGSVRSTAYRLRKQGLIQQDDKGWYLTSKGREYLAEKEKPSKKFIKSPFKKGEPRNLLFMFDIPHSQNRLRDWLRCQLRIFGYIMVQKSVWAGPSSLPKEFLQALELLEIKDCIRTFRLSRGYNESKF